MQDFAAKMHQILPPPKNAIPIGADLGEEAGRTAALPSHVRSSRHTVKGKEERECARDRKAV